MSKDRKARKAQEPKAVEAQAGLVQSFAARASSFVGPIPPPDILARYEQIVPGSAERIISMAEMEGQHRRALERQKITSEIRRSWGGLIIGGLLSFISVVGGIWLVSLGHDWAGGTIATMSVVGLAGVFVYGSQSLRAERIEKAKIMSGQR